MSLKEIKVYPKLGLCQPTVMRGFYFQHNTNQLNIEIMTNAELMNLSVEQLRDLNKRIIEVVKIKQQSVAFVNKGQLIKGMVAENIGNSTNIHYKEFEIVKINRTKAECKCVVIGKL